MRNFAVRLGITALVACALVAPAMAGVSGAGGGTKSVTESSKTVWTPDNVTKRTVDVIDQTLSTIKGYGRVYGARSANFYRETTVARAQQGAAISSIQTLLRGDVYSVPGRTASFSSGTTFLGNQNVLKWTESNTTQDSVSSSTASNRTLTTTPNTIIIGDPANLETAYVAQGHAAQHTDITVTKTNNKTETTTRHHDNINYYQVNVNRLISPIVLDLDGDGAIQASNGKWLPHPEKFDDSRVALFDYYGNGFPLLTEWVGPNDGLLCLPKKDGTVDGTCLFGSTNGYDNGFEALSVLDANGDWKLDGSELADLMVWQDKDGNAVATASELTSVQALGITSLSLNHTDFAATYTRDGKSMKMVDWWPNVSELRKKNMGAR